MTPHRRALGRRIRGRSRCRHHLRGGVEAVGIKPGDRRYSLTAGIIMGMPTTGLVNYLADAKRAMAIVLVGSALQLVAAIVALLA